MIINIEGNIGAGKIVNAESLCQILKLWGFKEIHIKEPEEDWINFNGENLLNLYYEDTKIWAFII